jgi:predicted lipoprotein with Yx(FWY)xxD motif
MSKSMSARIKNEKSSTSIRTEKGESKMKSLKSVLMSAVVLSLVLTVGAYATTAFAAPPAVMLQSNQNSSLGNILTDDKGMTLYTFAKDAAGQSNCTGGCAQAWPALTVADESAQLSLPEGASGKLGVIDRPDGSYQVTLDGKPLYHFARDAKAGDANGNGIGGAWWVIKIGQAAPAAPASSSSSW